MVHENHKQPRLSDNQLLIRPAARLVCPTAVEQLSKIRHRGLPALRGQEMISVLEGQPEELCYLFDFLPGASLDQLTDVEWVNWTFSERLNYLHELALLIGFLHSQGQGGLIHLDIKPANLLLDPDKRAALIDYDTLQFANDQQVAAYPETIANENLQHPITCTPAYAAPEVLRGQPCKASDFYSFGLCLLFILGVFNPEQSSQKDIAAAVASLTPALASCAAKCLMTDPLQRYLTANALAADLRNASAASAQTVASVSLADDAGRSGSEDALTAEESQKPADSAVESDRAGSSDPAVKPVPADKPEMPAFSRLLSVWDGPEFGCELAVSLRHYYAKVLVIDSDLINPQADLLLGKKSRQVISLPNSGADNLNLALQEVQRDTLTPGRLREIAWHTMTPQVDLLVFGDTLDEYDHIPPGNFIRLIEIARQSYPVVVLLLNRFIYDAFTCLGLMASDQVLIPAVGTAASFRSFNRSIEFLHLRRQIDPQRVRFIAFPYDERTDLSLGTLDVLSGNRLLGSIQTDLARQRRRGSAKPYALAVSPVNAREYDGIIARLNHQSRKESPDADRHLSRSIRRTIRLVSRPASARR